LTPLEAHFELPLEAQIPRWKRPLSRHHALLTGLVNVLELCLGDENRQNCALAVMNAP